MTSVRSAPYTMMTAGGAAGRRQPRSHSSSGGDRQPLSVSDDGRHYRLIHQGTQTPVVTIIYDDEDSSGSLSPGDRIVDIAYERVRTVQRDQRPRMDEETMKKIQRIFGKGSPDYSNGDSKNVVLTPVED